jgi:hypothetical protein
MTGKLADLMCLYEAAKAREVAIRRCVNDERRRLSAASRERYAIGRKLDEFRKASNHDTQRRRGDDKI